MWDIYSWLTVFLVTSTLVGVHAQKVYIPFDCRRSNSPCDVSVLGQCQSGGACQCLNTAQEGYNCGLTTARKVSGVCQVGCDSNRGQCYNDGTQHRCFCDARFYGPSCDRDRVAITGCTDTTLTVVINPHETNVFNGRIYVQGLDGVAACRIDTRATGPLQGFTKTLSLSTNPAANPCAAKLISSNVNDGDRVSRYNVVVQYDPTMNSPTDESHTFQCTQTATGQTIGLVLGNVGFDDVAAALLNGHSVNVGFSPIRMAVTRRPNRGPVTGNIFRVGTELFIEIGLITQATFAAIRVTTVTAYASDVVTQSTRRRVLVENSCPTEDSLGLVMPPLARIARTTFLMPFDMFKFIGSNTVYFTASAILCSQTDVNNCNPRDCDTPAGGAGRGYGRKKRQTPENGNVIEVNQRLFVIAADDDTIETCEDKKVETVMEKSCFESVAFIAVVAIFGLLLLVILMVLVLVACCRSKKSKKLAFDDQDDDFKSYNNPVTKM